MTAGWLRRLRFLFAWALLGLASATPASPTIASSDAVVLVAEARGAALVEAAGASVSEVGERRIVEIKPRSEEAARSEALLSTTSPLAPRRIAESHDLYLLNSVFLC